MLANNCISLQNKTFLPQRSNSTAVPYTLLWIMHITVANNICDPKLLAHVLARKAVEKLLSVGNCNCSSNYSRSVMDQQ